MIVMNLLPWFLKIPGHERNVRIPSAPDRVVILEDTIPTSEPPEDSFGWMSAGPITQWGKPQGGSVTIIPSESGIDWAKADFTTPIHHQYGEWLYEEGYVEMSVKVALVLSPIPTIGWFIEGAKNLLPEEEVIYY